MIANSIYAAVLYRAVVGVFSRQVFAWRETRTSLLVGLLASQFVDADMLKVFAQWDLRDVRVENMDLGRVQRKAAHA